MAIKKLNPKDLTAPSVGGVVEKVMTPMKLPWMMGNQKRAVKMKNR